MDSDILADCMARLIRAGVDPQLAIMTISEVRKDWGSDTPYIRKVDRQQRDRAISEALTAGLPVDEVAQKVGCSARTIRRKRSEFLI